MCSESEVYVHYVAINDLVITTPLKKKKKKNDIAALWSCSGKAGASLLGQDAVASLLSLCMAKWLRKWRRGWLYVRSNTKHAKSVLCSALILCHYDYASSAWFSSIPQFLNKVVLKSRVSPENTSKYMDRVTVFAKTWTKGHWPLDDLWHHICWGLKCDFTQGSLCPSSMKIKVCEYSDLFCKTKKLEVKVIDPFDPTSVDVTCVTLRSSSSLFVSIIIYKLQK